jgi:hypothetical protein
MTWARMKVDVGDGMFSMERSVFFAVGDRTYSLVVQQEDLEGDFLKARRVPYSIRPCRS